MAEDKATAQTGASGAESTRSRSSSKSKAKSSSTKSHSDSSSGGSSKVNDMLNAIVNHVTRNGSEADDALLANLHEVSGGKVGRVARGTTDENSPQEQQ